MAEGDKVFRTTPWDGEEAVECVEGPTLEKYNRIKKALWLALHSGPDTVAGIQAAYERAAWMVELHFPGYEEELERLREQALTECATRSRLKNLNKGE
jgi:hypothetical protein